MNHAVHFEAVASTFAQEPMKPHLSNVDQICPCRDELQLIKMAKAQA